MAVSGCLMTAQVPASEAPLKRALEGNWAGTLEYRDYAEAATSEKRVKLPTWLTVSQAGGDLRFEYVYDDGPDKVVRETSVIRIDVAGAAYSVIGSGGKVEDRYEVTGFRELKEGRGTLVMTGTGVENNVPVSVRTTLRVRRNLLEILRETGAPGEPLRFRHSYSMVRSSAPRQAK